jgi:hypothetical protein
MFEVRRPLGRLFCLLLPLLMALVSQAQGPATTTVSDVVYRADSSPAGRALPVSVKVPGMFSRHIQRVGVGDRMARLGRTTEETVRWRSLRSNTCGGCGEERRDT